MISLTQALPPNSVIGILGAGQLGRMLALAAADLGYRVCVFAPKGDNPAIDVAWRAVEADYDDAAALRDFAGLCDVVTYEFENVPADTADILSGHVALAPDPAVLATTQDRLSEKRFLDQAGIAVAPWRPIDSAADLDQARRELGAEAILKTRRLGYDGKGQVALSEALTSQAALDRIGDAPCVLEARMPFRCEISVIAARDRFGGFAAYDPGENRHENHILATTTVPAALDPELRDKAITIARRIAEAFGYVGVFGVEFFVLPGPNGDSLCVNEIAPRVHNSGHWTQAACPTSQFAQHIRCVAGWPVAEADRLADARMTNLLGDDATDPELARFRDAPGLSVHLYGKAEARPGRKMGHVTQVFPRGTLTAD